MKQHFIKAKINVFRLKKGEKGVDLFILFYFSIGYQI